MPGGVANRGILLIGCGKMGGALLRGWIASGSAGDGVTVVEPAAAALAPWQDRPDIRRVASAAALPPELKPAVVVVAVKPQNMDAVLPDFRRFAAGGAVFLSIAAGKTIAYFTQRLGDDAAVVRAMPNLPASIGAGATALCANARVTPPQRALCDALMAAVGAAVWVEEEGLIDTVTAVSGSGPAYVFLLAECLAEAAAAAGLPPDLAQTLARATVAGSGALLAQSADPPAALRQAVTSPGGTTAAALSVLMSPQGLRDLMIRAVAAAAARSRELAG